MRQEQNDKLRKEFAQHANSFHSWLTETRSSMMEGTGTLEEQVELNLNLLRYISVHFTTLT